MPRRAHCDPRNTHGFAPVARRVKQRILARRDAPRRRQTASCVCSSRRYPRGRRLPRRRNRCRRRSIFGQRRIRFRARLRSARWRNRLLAVPRRSGISASSAGMSWRSATRSATPRVAERAPSSFAVLATALGFTQKIAPNDLFRWSRLHRRHADSRPGQRREHRSQRANAIVAVNQEADFLLDIFSFNFFAARFNLVLFSGIRSSWPLPLLRIPENASRFTPSPRAPQELSHPGRRCWGPWRRSNQPCARCCSSHPPCTLTGPTSHCGTVVRARQSAATPPQAVT